MEAHQTTIDETQIEMLTLRGALFALRDSTQQADDQRKGEVEHALAKLAEQQAERVLAMIEGLAESRPAQDLAA